MIWLMVILLTFFGDVEYGFSNMRVGAVLGNWRGIQGQYYVALLQGSEMAAEFHYRNWNLGICFRLSIEHLFNIEHLQVF